MHSPDIEQTYPGKTYPGSILCTIHKIFNKTIDIFTASTETPP